MTIKRLLRQCSILMLCVLFTQIAFSQTKTISGKISDDKGNPVQGATVTVRGVKAGTSTDAAGMFKLNVPATAKTLVISSVGFAQQEISIAGKESFDVSLVPSTQALTDVVVIGYQSVRKKDLTGAVASLQAKNFNQGSISSPDQLLQSKVAGVLVTANSGEPGAGTTINIRGNSSLRSSAPLYIVDGVPLDGRNAEPGNGGTSFGGTPSSNPLLFINPNDIASIDVLKDASAAAIYGSRGANGVIAITTKKGTSGATKIEAGVGYTAFAGYMKKFDILSSSQFVSALSKYNVPGAANLNGGKSVDALKAITSNTVSQAYNLAISGGNENGKYRASFFANNAEGFVKGTGLQKYIGTFSGTAYALDKRLTIDFNVIAGNVGHRFGLVTNTAGSQGNLISAALQWNPTMSFTDATTGQYIFPTNGSGNPLAFIAAVNDKAVTNTILGNISASYKIVKGLEYKFLYAINHSSGIRNVNYPGWLQGYSGVSGLGYAAIANALLNSQTFTHTLSYNADLTKDLRLTALAGYEYWTSDFSTNAFQASGFNTNLTQSTIIPVLYTNMMQDANTQVPPTTYADPTTQLQSLFGRAILNYADRYLITATVRRDGSSKFGKNDKYGVFPSFAGRWNISNENFMKSSKLFSSLALRGSWGVTGSQEFASGSAQEQFAFTAYNAAGQVNVYNPDLKWEQTTSSNVGLEFSLLKGRVYGTLDWYNKNTTNLLFQSSAIQPAPAASTWVNIPANVINKGFEISLGGTIVQTKDFTWDLGFNWAYNTNKLTNFNEALIQTAQINGQGLSGALGQAIANNQPLEAFYLKHFSGFDQNGLQQISANPQFAGDPNQKNIYGITTTLRYKKVELVINGGGASHFLIYNNTANGVTNIGGILQGRNIDKNAYNSKESSGDGLAASDRWLENGNFFKLRNATVRYNFGSIGNFVKNATVFLSGNNLFVITKFSGFDPEVNIDKSSGVYPSKSIEYIPYPTARSFTFGLNFSL